MPSSRDVDDYGKTLEALLDRASAGEDVFGLDEALTARPVADWSEDELAGAIRQAIVVTREANRRLTDTFGLGGDHVA